MDATPEGVDIIWKEVFQVDTTLNFDDPLIKEKFLSVTNKIVEKIKTHGKTVSTGQSYHKKYFEVEHWTTISGDNGIIKCEEG
jgi:hypothetical protein